MVETIPVIPVGEDTISFTTQIEPLMDLNCSTSGCHDASASAGGYNLTGHLDISTQANIILSAIKHETPNLMPLGSPQIADSLIAQFETWINQGLLDN
ncbi:MAG: hypothetical protein JKY09_03380 [Crocinitomicaceae bacterium]|nr:hypothetical protein [Crocinitomicaceae bacterium]